MQKNFIPLMAAVTVLTAAVSCAPKQPQYANKAEKVIAEIHNPDSRYVIVASHRGDWRNYPENSLPVIESVIRMGVDIMELDLKLTKDSVLVLSHDWTCDRMTNGKGRIETMTYDSLMTFNLKTAHGVRIPGTHIATLREALEVCKDRIVVNVDQGWEYYDMVIAITEELGVTDQILIKGKKPIEKVAQKMAGHAHNMMYMPIIDIQKPQGAALFQSYLDVGEVPLAYEVCFSELDDVARDCAKKVVEQGSKLWVNTLWASLNGGYDDDRAYDAADPGEVYDVILDLGTSMIQTDRPEFLIKYLEKKGRR